MTLPKSWMLPLSIIKEEEASLSPRAELDYMKISELDPEDRPNFYEVARHIVENSSIPPRFYDDVMGWLIKGFQSLDNWQAWLLKPKPGPEVPIGVYCEIVDDEDPPVLEPEAIESKSSSVASTSKTAVSSTKSTK